MKLTDVLLGREGAEGIRWLLLSAAPRKVLRDQLKTQLFAGAALGPCRLRRIRFKPGRKLAAYYDTFVTVEGGRRYCARPISVTWQMCDADRQVYSSQQTTATLQDEAAHRGVAFPFVQLAGRLPNWGMDFSVSPLDIEFPQLIRLLDLAHVRDIFASMGTSVPLFCKPRLGSCRVTSVRYRPGQRHVLRYDERGAHRSIFAKLYARGKAAEVFRIVTQAGEWLAQSMPGASVVCPVAHVIEDDAVFYDGLLGTALSDLIGQPWRKLTTYLERAGDMLRTLHQLPKVMAGPLETHDFAAELSEVARTGAYIGVLLPAVGRAVESILERAGRVHGRLGQEPPTFTHGDFKSEHVWVSAGGLTLMDFDSSRFGDPALDVGKFLAYLQLSQINRPQPDLQVAEAGFLAAYGRGVPEERLLRAQLYKTVELLKITARRVSVTDADWASRTEKLIACAEHLMTDLELVLGLPVVEASAAGSRTRGLRIRAGRTPVPRKGVRTQWMTR